MNEILKHYAQLHVIDNGKKERGKHEKMSRSAWYETMKKNGHISRQKLPKKKKHRSSECAINFPIFIVEY